MGKPNREILTGGKRYAQKKTKKNRVEEVTFDRDSRIEYLTGFHKRKLQRQKQAQENAKEMQRHARLEERKQIREERKQQIQERLEQLNKSKDILNYKDSSDEESDSESDELQKQDCEDESSCEEWTGFEGDENETTSNKSSGKKGILKVKQVYQIEDESAPVSGTSEVVIESLENPGLIDLTSIAKLNHVDLEKSKEVLENSINRAKKYAKLVNAAEKPQKIRKKKFRYLSKNERGIKNMKERNSSRNQRGRKEAKDKGSSKNERGGKSRKRK